MLCASSAARAVWGRARARASVDSISTPDAGRKRLRGAREVAALRRAAVRIDINHSPCAAALGRGAATEFVTRLRPVVNLPGSEDTFLVYPREPAPGTR